MLNNALYELRCVLMQFCVFMALVQPVYLRPVYLSALLLFHSLCSRLHVLLRARVLWALPALRCTQLSQQQSHMYQAYEQGCFVF